MSYTRSEAVETVRAWMPPRGFEVALYAYPKSRSGVMIKLTSDEGCNVSWVPGARVELRHIHTALDLLTHALLRDHAYCKHDCRDRALRRRGRKFEDWIEEYIYYRVIRKS
jgi:hypothetical protein